MKCFRVVQRRHQKDSMTQLVTRDHYASVVESIGNCLQRVEAEGLPAWELSTDKQIQLLALLVVRGNSNIATNTQQTRD